MKVESIFLDSDLVIDFLTDRQPFSESSSAIFGLVEAMRLKVYVSALSFSNIHYIIGRLHNRSKADSLIGDLLKLVHISPVDAQVVTAAYESEISDFEDALQHFSAQTVGVSTIVTRNTKDYKNGLLAVHTPESYLELLRSEDII